MAATSYARVLSADNERASTKARRTPTRTERHSASASNWFNTSGIPPPPPPTPAASHHHHRHQRHPTTTTTDTSAVPPPPPTPAPCHHHHRHQRHPTTSIDTSGDPPPPPPTRAASHHHHHRHQRLATINTTDTSALPPPTPPTPAPLLGMVARGPHEKVMKFLERQRERERDLGGVEKVVGRSISKYLPLRVFTI
ncbi:hypothetical protein PPROV_001074300 [Pycnococcus provasolii]|uniref:Uncharacterized protein n=1 Tax=Pycnococcus provasolii TaxID=41880 RepID=A0A830HX31_9CHLO|nr:hypothetical protein PPROV_001074300 [Pycnococcus provasolii]